MCCCCSVVNPGLLGQLILATVATQAARNSLAAVGTVGVALDSLFLDVAQEINNKAKNEYTICRVSLVCIVSFLKGNYCYKITVK